MSTNQTAAAFCRQEWEYEHPVPGGILVAVDGSPESIAALNTGAAIARRRRIQLHAASVIPPLGAYRISPGTGARQENLNELRISLKDSELGVLMDAVGCEEQSWTHSAIIGDTAPSLAHAAEKRNAELIIVGRHSRGAIDRFLSGDTTLQLMRQSSIPVLAVDVDTTDARKAVVAVDFSPASIAAAAAALNVLAAPATLYVVYVEPPAELLPAGFSLPSEDRFAGDLAACFRRVTEKLGTRAGVLIEPCVLTGQTGPCLLEYVERVGADLIAAGSHGFSRVERILLGSVSEALVKKAPCGVLVAPARC